MPSALGWDAGDEGGMQQRIAVGPCLAVTLSMLAAPLGFWFHGFAQPTPVFSVVWLKAVSVWGVEVW